MNNDERPATTITRRLAPTQLLRAEGDERTRRQQEGKKCPRDGTSHHHHHRLDNNQHHNHNHNHILNGDGEGWEVATTTKRAQTTLDASFGPR
jgi:hypothetical protein